MTLYLALPDNPDAQRALDRRPNGRDPYYWASKMGSLALAWWAMVTILTAHPGLIWIMAAIVAVLCLTSLTLVTRNALRNLAFKRHIRAGHIIAVDSYLADAWHDLLAEHDIALSDEQCAGHLRGLYFAARDVQPDLQRRAEAVQTPELAKQQLAKQQLAEARIRARLMREITPIKDAIVAERQAIASLPPAPDWATTDEVAEQLALLRARRTQP